MEVKSGTVRANFLSAWLYRKVNGIWYGRLGAICCIILCSHECWIQYCRFGGVIGCCATMPL